MTGYVEGNRAAWDRRSTEYAAYGRRAWAREEPVWGIWHLAERDSNDQPIDRLAPDGHARGIRPAPRE